jgi:hypothetical protein
MMGIKKRGSERKDTFTTDAAVIGQFRAPNFSPISPWPWLFPCLSIFLRRSRKPLSRSKANVLAREQRRRKSRSAFPTSIGIVFGLNWHFK